MMLSCSDIGISGCEFNTRGYDGDALDGMLEHLRSRHGYRITRDDVDEKPNDRLEEPERMIAARLHRRMEEGVAG
jgi:predicted small metal-binding protein